jgi:hypothetical protein
LVSFLVLDGLVVPMQVLDGLVVPMQVLDGLVFPMLVDYYRVLARMVMVLDQLVDHDWRNILYRKKVQ